MHLIKKIILIIIFAITTNNVFALECPKSPKPKLHFSIQKKQTKFDFSKSAKDLTRENNYQNPNFTGWINEGIMSTKFPNYTIKTKVQGLVYPKSNKACYYVSDIFFDWILEPTIFVASDYKKGSCKYNTVIAHERQHVAIDIALLNKYKNAIRYNLEHQANKPIETGLITPNPNINLLKPINEELIPLVNRMVAERNARQGLIDTEAEYKRLAKKCR